MSSCARRIGQLTRPYQSVPDNSAKVIALTNSNVSQDRTKKLDPSIIRVSPPVNTITSVAKSSSYKSRFFELETFLSFQHARGLQQFEDGRMIWYPPINQTVDIPDEVKITTFSSDF